MSDVYITRVTRADYNSFCFADYALVIDGVGVPPACRYRLDDGHEKVEKLGHKDLAALRTLMNAPGEALPWRTVLPSANPKAATEHWSKLRRKLGPAREAFVTVPGGTERQYCFQPQADLPCCLLELVPAKVESAKLLPSCDRCGPYPLTANDLFPEDPEQYGALLIAQQLWWSRHARCGR